MWGLKKSICKICPIWNRVFVKYVRPKQNLVPLVFLFHTGDWKASFLGDKLTERNDWKPSSAKKVFETKPNEKENAITGGFVKLSFIKK